MCVAAMRIGMLSDVTYIVSSSTSLVAAVLDQPGGWSWAQVAPMSSDRKMPDAVVTQPTESGPR